MRSPRVDVAVKRVTGEWSILGRGADGAGAYPSELVASANYGGPDTLAFSVRRDAARPWADLAADAPVRLYVDGTRVWAGRIVEVAGAGRWAVNVSAAGWQYALDDAVLDAAWVYADTSAWRDARTLLSADLTVYRAAAFADVDDGAIRLGWPEDARVATGDRAAVVLDLGSSSTIDIRRVVAAWARIGGAANCRFRCAVFDASSQADLSYYSGQGSLDQATLATIGGTQLWDVDLSTTGSGTSTSTAGPYAGRYAILYVQWTGANATLTADVGVRINAAVAYAGAGTDYYSGGTTLVASTVVNDVLARCAAWVSSDRRRMGTTTFVLPHFATEGVRSAREIIDAALAYDAARFGVDAFLRPVLYADPTAPTISVGVDSSWEDAAIARADDVISAAAAEAEGPAGGLLRAWRSGAAAAGGGRQIVAAATQPTNADFESGTAGWVTVAGSPASTATADTGSLALNLVGDGSGNVEAKSSAVPVVAGRAYRLRVRVRRTAGATGTLRLTVALDADPSTGGAARRSFRTHEVDLASLTAGVYATVTADVVAQQTGAVTIGLGVYGGAPVSSSLAAVDGVAWLEHVDSPSDRFGFGRVRVVDTGVATSPAGVAKLGDAYALSRRRAPMRGRVTVYGASAVAIGEARPVRAADLLLRFGEGVALRSVRDPWTGALGRWGVIANVEWAADGNVATLDVDAESGGFEALLERVGALTGRVS